MQKICFLATLFLASFNIVSAQLPTGFSTIYVASGWTEPVGATFSTDGQQLFVWEKAGKVFVCKRDASGTYIKQSTPVLDISSEVGNWRDHGLLGFTLDPNYLTNGLVYLLYVVDRHYLMNFGTSSYNAEANDYYSATIGRVTRYKTIASGSNIIADVSTRSILLGESPSTGIPILYQSHGVGSLVFAADGTLLVSAGDGACYDVTDPGNISFTYYAQALADGIIRSEENVGSFRSQLLNSHNGKILRIDPATGDGISSNPFYSADAPRSAKSRVWALGLRNPFRFTVKPGTGSTNPAVGDIGEIYVGDVGYDTYEELDIINAPGVNCGWPLFEGLTSLSSYANLNTQNKDEPNPLYGAGCTQQFFYFKNLIKQATADNISTLYNPCNTSTPIGTGNRFFHHRPSLEWKHSGNITRVGIFNGNTASEAQIGTPASGVVGSPFVGSASVGGTWYSGTLFPATYQNTFLLGDYSGGWIKSLSVDFTDVVQKVQSFATNFAIPVCIVENPLDGTVVCVDYGNTVRIITFGGNQLPVAKLSADKTYGPSTLAVNFTGNTSFDPDGTSLTYQWNFGDPNSGSANTSTLANPSHSFTASSGSPTKFVVKLTVKDVNNATVTDSMIISVNNTPPVVHITAPVNNAFYIPTGNDSVISCTAIVVDAEHSPDKLKYAWQTILRHNTHQHPEPIDTARITATTISNIGCNGDTYYWHIELTVTDEAGLSTKDSVNIYPNCSPVNTPVMLNGSIILQGIPPAPNAQWQIPLQIKLYTDNNLVPVYSFDVTTDQNGSFVTPEISTGGIYTIAVKGNHTLQRVKTGQILNAGNNNISFGTLIEGDADNNNTVNLFDFAILLSTYNKTAADLDYDNRGDFNNDGIVNLFDFALLLASYNQVGEAP